MFNRWRTPLRRLQFSSKSQVFASLSSVVVPQHSVSTAAAATSTSVGSVASPEYGDYIVRNIVYGVTHLGFRDFISRRELKGLIAMLSTEQVDSVIEALSRQNGESAVDFFHLLRKEFGFRHSTAASLVVSHVLAGMSRFREMRNVVDQMLRGEGSGSAPSICELLSSSRFKSWDSTNQVWDVLAFAYSRFEMVQDSLFVLVKMKDSGLAASVQTYNSLMHNLRHTDTLWDVYNDIKASGSRPNDYSGSILVDGLCRQSRLPQAVSLMCSEDHKPSVVLINTIMSGYCKLGFVEVAKSFFCMMLKHGLLPDVYSYNILIHGLCIAGSVEEALEVASSMEVRGVQPDIVTYNVLAKGFNLLGLMSGATRMIEEMLLKERNLDSVTYTILIYGHCQTGNISEALKLCEEMVSKGLQLNVLSLSVLLCSLCKIGETDEALKLLYAVEDNGLKPDLVTYSVLIHGLCKQGEVYNAIQVYNKMCSNRISPSSIEHCDILRSFRDKGMLHEARDYFDSLVSANDYKLDIVVYNVMIDAYVKHGDIQGALQLYRQITEKGVFPNIVTFNSLIYGLCINGMMDQATGLLQTIKLHGLLPNAVTYTTIMNAYAGNGDVSNVLVLLQEMKRNKTNPSHITYTVLIKACCKEWKLQEALHFLEEMKSEGLTPDAITYNIIIVHFCKVKELSRAFSLVEEMLMNHLQPTPATYNVLIDGLCFCGNLRTADRLMISLQRREIELTKVAYTTLIKAYCAKRSDVERAVVWFHQMLENGFNVEIRDYSAVINRLCKRNLVGEAKYFLQMMLGNGVSPDWDICNVMITTLYSNGNFDQVSELLAVSVKFAVLNLSRDCS
ncbi:Putative pentatricopeptide repeat-containing protein At1g13630 [Linum perenne]